MVDKKKKKKRKKKEKEKNMTANNATKQISYEEKSDERVPRTCFWFM